MKSIRSVIFLVFILFLIGSTTAAVTQYNFTDGSYSVIVFNGTGTTTWPVPNGVTTVQYLVVAGGGGGGAHGDNTAGGGGGAGGLLSGTSLQVSGEVPVVVGKGGDGGIDILSSGVNGTNSSFGSIESKGGGGGLTRGYGSGTNGGSGAGAPGRFSTTANTTGVPGQGYDGGRGTANTGYGGGGGGGAGEPGQNAVTSYAGNGGNGTTSTIFNGTPIYYAGGGGGGVYSGGTRGLGGLGGGGNGGSYTTGDSRHGRNATNGTGGGGGGGGYHATAKPNGGRGGDGIVIIRYLTPTADVTPPASITNLQNTTICNTINWTWTNPGDPDFNHTMIYRDNILQYTLSNTTSFDLWSGLSELTSYTISTRTCDITGNCNSSFVNKTSITSTCVPVSDFSANETAVCVNAPIQFTDLTTNSPTIWGWAFGDGNISTLQNPVYSYAYAGIFDVSLNATNGYGSNIKTKSGYITVNNCTPETDFTYNATCGVGNLTVQFTDTSTGGTSWFWDTGDGNTSLARNLTFLYQIPGVYTVRHNATNSYGTSWLNRSNLITVALPGTFCTGGSGNGTGEPTYQQIAGGDEVWWTAGIIGVLGLVVVFVALGKRRGHSDDYEEEYEE